jgi:hypothetical protein
MQSAHEITLVTGVAPDMALVAVVSLGYFLASLEIGSYGSRLHKTVELVISCAFGYITSRTYFRVAVEHIDGLAAAVAALPSQWTVSTDTITHTLVVFGFSIIAVTPVLLFIGFSRANFNSNGGSGALSELFGWIGGKFSPPYLADQDPADWIQSYLFELMARIGIYVVIMLLFTLTDLVPLPEGKLLTVGSVISILVSSSPLSIIAIPIALVVTDLLVG